jgi:hypothetical protein
MAISNLIVLIINAIPSFTERKTGECLVAVSGVRCLFLVDPGGMKGAGT